MRLAFPSQRLLYTFPIELSKATKFHLYKPYLPILKQIIQVKELIHVIDPSIKDSRVKLTLKS